MNILISLHNAVFSRIEGMGNWLLPTAARLVFAGVLLIYFWHSATLKIGSGIFGVFSPSFGSYYQIFPRVMETAGGDPSQLGTYHSLVIIAGTLAEFILPALIVLGLLTRLAAIGMIGFIIVQSATDIIGHGADEKTIGGWFDRMSDSLIMDQRAFWMLALLVLVIKGAGPLSLDRLLSRQAASG